MVTTQISYDDSRITRRFSTLLMAVLIGVGVLSLATGQKYPVTELLDIWLISLMVYLVCKGRTQAWVLFLLVCSCLAIRLGMALVNEAPLYDFFQAYRWLVYLAVLALAIGRRLVNARRSLVTLTFSLLGLALANATVTVLQKGSGARPALLLENNFELALFCGLAVVIYNWINSRQRLTLITMLGALTLMASSRSGMVIFAVFWVFALLSSSSTNAFVRYISVCALPLVVIVVAYVFDQRDSGRTIDRVNFLNVFLEETSSWSPIEWIFGTVPITPLSSGACERLSYYDALFSSVGDGTCYSVILHSFVMRVIYDAGFIGLVASVAVPLYAMRKAGCSRLSTYALLAMSVANGLSVSGINNPYVLLPTLLAILTVNEDTKGEPTPDSRMRPNSLPGEGSSSPAIKRPQRGIGHGEPSWVRRNGDVGIGY